MTIKTSYSACGKGPAVVLLHGSMASRLQWRSLAGDLQQEFRVITMDLIGYGATPRPENLDFYSLADESELLCRILDKELGDGHAYHVVGHSYGGVVALHHAYHHRDRVASLTLIEPMAYHLLPEDHENIRLAAAMVEEIRADIASGEAITGAEKFIDLWMPPGTFSRLSEREKSALAEGVKKMIVDFRAAATEPLTLHDYRRLPMPICLITGRTSPPFSLCISEHIAAFLPEIERHQVDGGHFSPVSHAHQVNPLIGGFLRRVEARSLAA